jgi:hypothetical protein
MPAKNPTINAEATIRLSSDRIREQTLRKGGRITIGI